MSVEGVDGSWNGMHGTTAPGTLALQEMSHVARNTPSLQTLGCWAPFRASTHRCFGRKTTLWELFFSDPLWKNTIMWTQRVNKPIRP